jgi:hypothetical protein
MPGTGVNSLTTRERQIAQGIVDRQTIRQDRRGAKTQPAGRGTHVCNRFAKLDADSRVEARA